MLPDQWSSDAAGASTGTSRISSTIRYPQLSTVEATNKQTTPNWNSEF
jgi:hypothetical protein